MRIISALLKGGHTGSIQANGGAGRYTNDGSGSGGRIAIYHGTKVTDGEYNGALTTRGGAVESGGAEAGAAGTVYLKHVFTGGAVLMVDNDGRRPITNEIENIGRRLDCDGGDRSTSSSYYSASGVKVVTSSGPYNPW